MTDEHLHSALITTTGDDTLAAFEPALRAALAGKAPHTRRAYRARVRRFAAWRAAQPPADLLTHLEEYVEHLRAEGMAPRSVQAHLSTLKTLVRTAVARYGDDEAFRRLPRLDTVSAPPVRGTHQGDRLSREQLQLLLEQPDLATHKGRRDVAILALMGVTGLRRSEVAGLEWRHIGELDGHKVILNLVGKHGRERTVKLPAALWRAIQRWAEEAGLDTSPDVPVFVPVLKGDRVQPGRRVPASSLAHLVGVYVEQLRERGYRLPAVSPHDLRRTAAHRARRGGASIEQVQLMLGHASPQTTSQYIGETLDLDDHAVDYADVAIP